METPFAEIARRALAKYGLEAAGCEFLQHRENVTFKVTAPDGSPYALRIHVPVTPHFGSHGADADMVRSEMLWLEALRRTSGLPVPHPQRNRDAGLVTVIEVGSSRYNVTLLDWLPGEIAGAERLDDDSVAQMGTLVGKLHYHSSRWRRPRDFIRPQRDAAHFKDSLRALEPAVSDGRITRQDFARFEESVRLLTEYMQRTRRRLRQEHGLLHGDLHRGNFLFADGHLGLIDFSMCAIGSFLFDLGVCLSSIPHEYHPIFLVNYQRYFQLPPDAFRMIEGYFVASMVGTFTFWMDDPEAQEHLVSRVPRIANEYAARFIRDERFWFTEPEF
jgi:prepilin-type processing-associated H-X9-DG protein